MCDTGVGIAKEDLERIFDRFYQAGDAVGRRNDGTGIGLAIVRNILQLHGCVVHATSEVGEGTVLSFTLPVAEEKTEAQHAPSPPILRPILRAKQRIRRPPRPPHPSLRKKRRGAPSLAHHPAG